jgi:uncharacterized protein (DUF2141 family)
MKTLGCIIISLLLVNFSVDRNWAQPTPSGTGTLIVLVTGLDNNDGQLLVALYDDSKSYLGETPTIGANRVITGKEEFVRFDGLPYGQYAVVVLHDLNKDMDMNKNFLGIPTEGYGFSNNVMGKCGPPSYDQARFDFAQRYETKIIDLQYGIPK